MMLMMLVMEKAAPLETKAKRAREGRDFGSEESERKQGRNGEETGAAAPPPPRPPPPLRRSERRSAEESAAKTKLGFVSAFVRSLVTR